MSLRDQLIKLAYQEDALREALLPLLTQSKSAGTAKSGIFQHLIHHQHEHEHNPHLRVHSDPNSKNEYHWDPEAKAVVRKKSPEPKKKTIWEKTKALLHPH